MTDMRMSTVETRILTTICATSFLFMTALLSYSYLMTEPPAKAQKVTVVEKSGKNERLAPNSVKVKLVAKKHISPDTVYLDFRFTEKGIVVPVGKHIKVFCRNPNCIASATWNNCADSEAGRDVIERKYTPIASTEEGFVLVVKCYRPNDKFSNGGKVSQYLANLCTDEEVEIALPFGIMEYLKNGSFRRAKSSVETKFVGMLAGGSGITPMFRLLDAALADKKDTTKFSLVFANRGEQDILLRERLDKMAADNPQRFKVAYTLTRPPEGWNGEAGLITKEVIKAYMPPPSPETLILCCGPPQMIKTCCKENLEALGYTPQQIWDF